MIWLPPTKRLALRRLREAKPKIRELGNEIHRLRRTPALPNHNTPPPLPPPRSTSSTTLDTPVPRPLNRLTTTSTPESASEIGSSTSTARVSPEGKKERLGFYLRSGTVQILKPLRYERRVARNRAIAWGVISGILILLSLAFLFNLFRH